MRLKVTERLVQSLKSKDKPYEVWDSELRGFLVRVQPSGVRAYYCVWHTLEGRKSRLALGKSPVLGAQTARQRALTVLSDAAQGIYPHAQRQQVTDLSLRHYVETQYAPWVIAHRKSGLKTVKRLQSRFKEFLDLSLCELTTRRLEEWRTCRIQAGLKKATVNRDLASLKSALSKAVGWGAIAIHPCLELKPCRANDSDEKTRFLSPDEERQLRVALAARDKELREERFRANSWRRVRGYEGYPDLTKYRFADYLEPMVLLSLNTGLRRGELFHLNWSDVDTTGATLVVRPTVAKSGKMRHVPLNKEALQVLLDWRRQSSATELVFTSLKGRAFDNVQTAWERLLKRALIGDFRWHDMRHHFASRLVIVGVDINTVRELLGHSDLKMTLRYAHLAPHVKRAAVEKLVTD